ncbi:MAG: MarR family transcriptional regulator [Sphingomonas bacterium]|jgi:DNA-binding MarR family transcriptional regulator|nr:MarR family transcriptional regulator [Sphingomonas bacterium]
MLRTSMADRSLVLDDFIPYRLSIASNLVSSSIAGTYEALFGMKIPEWRMIAVIAENKGLTQQDIGRRTRMDKMTVSRAAAILVERGLLDRLPNPDDRRSHRLVLSADGRALYGNVAPKALELEQRIFGRFGCDELAGFVTMLRRIESAALDALGGQDGRSPADR